MSDERTAADASSPASEPDDEHVARLLERAGRRQDIPPEHLAAIKTAFRSEWEAHVAVTRARRRGGRNRTFLAAAAAVAVAALAGWWVVSRGAPTARVETVVGVALASDPGADPHDPQIALSLGQRLARGARVETAALASAAPGSIALRLPGGASLRLDAGTNVRLLTAKLVELERGGLYIDSGPQGRGAVTVRTPLATVTDIGTQFEVRLLEGGESLRAVRLRVREGQVALDVAGRPAAAGAVGAEDMESSIDPIDAGTELVLHSNGTVERHAIAPWGDDWRWVLAVAPPFVASDASLGEFLAWVARESGWTIRFEDEELAARAAEIEVHGTLSAIPPDMAPLVLQSAGLSSELIDGVLLVRRAAPGAAP